MNKQTNIATPPKNIILSLNLYVCKTPLFETKRKQRTQKLLETNLKVKVTIWLHPCPLQFLMTN